MRNLLAWGIPVAAILAIAWATFATRLPDADFTFVNATEVKSIDPALITGQPEGRIVNAIFEGLVRWHPETLEPMPGVAERWEISDDRLVYTFHIRKGARWSDGTSVTAHDFHYSLRRFLDPRTAAEYAYQAWYIKNAREYSLGGHRLRPGDPVEIEVNLSPEAVNTRRGKLLHGTLFMIENPAIDEERVFVVEIDGQQQRFRTTDDDTAASVPPHDGVHWCRQVLLDFNQVGIQVKDDHTLQVTLENPTPYFLSLMGFYPMHPVNQKCVEAFGTPAWTRPENLVGNGAYNIEFRRIRDRIRLVKSDTYWNRENVSIETIDALAIDSNTTALNLFMTDQVDWIVDTPPAALRILLEEDPPRNDLNPATYFATYFYLLNTTRRPIDDLRVRRALSLALDREEICSKILAAGETPALSLVPPGVRGYEAQESFAENADEARRLLAEAGYPEGRGFPRIDILYNTHETHRSIAELIRKQWQRELGIAVRTRSEEWGSYLSSQRQMTYNIARKGWIGDYADPNTFLDMFVTDGENNNTGWSNREYDQLIDDARSEPDPQERLQLLEQAERLLMNDLPILPIYFYVSKNMVKPHVRGLYNNIRDEHPLWAMWIDRKHDGPNEFMSYLP